MALVKTQVTQEVADYLARHARQDAILERVARETSEMPMAVMATTPDEAALLTMLARLTGARRALEVGTFTGFGAIAIARGSQRAVGSPAWSSTRSTRLSPNATSRTPV